MIDAVLKFISIDFHVVFFQAFSLLFLTLSFCSDLICLMFLPVHWLFFAASTYVWVQFVWHTGNAPLVFLICQSTNVHINSYKKKDFFLSSFKPFAPIEIK